MLLVPAQRGWETFWVAWSPASLPEEQNYQSRPTEDARSCTNTEKNGGEVSAGGTLMPNA